MQRPPLGPSVTQLLATLPPPVRSDWRMATMLLGRTDAQWNVAYHSMVFYRLVLTVAMMFMLVALIPAGFIQWREWLLSFHSELIFNLGFVLAVALPLGLLLAAIEVFARAREYAPLARGTPRYATVMEMLRQSPGVRHYRNALAGQRRLRIADATLMESIYAFENEAAGRAACRRQDGLTS